MDNKENTDEIALSRLITRFGEMSKEEKIGITSLFLKELKRTRNINEHELFSRREISVPIGIFENDVLSSLEAVVKYMKEDLRIKFFRIAKLLNRSNKTVWATYNNSLKKMPLPFGQVSRDILIPASVFCNRSFSTLECIVLFLKEREYSNHEIAEMLHLDDRTIWTVYDRVKKKKVIEIGKIEKIQ